MGFFSKLFNKKKDIKGINEFAVEEKPVAPKAEPKKAPAPAPKTEPKKEATPAPKAEPKKTAAPAPKAEPKKEAAPAPKAEPKKAPAPAPKAELKKEATPAPKAEPKNEPAPAPKEEAASAQRTGRFEIKKAKDGRFVFNLYAPNHVIVATSQVYSSSAAAVNGIKSIINNAEKATIEDNSLKAPTEQSFPKWEIYVDKGGQYRFRLFATNGSCVVHSQGYTAKNSCKKGIESIIKCAKNAEIDKSYLAKKDEK